MNYNSFRYITRKEFPLSLFSFIGLGVTTNNPQTFYQGKWHNLRPLKTELNDYSPVSLVIPFGIGVGYRQTENLNFNLTVGYRYTFTDYLDDVSTTYQDPKEFTNPLALELQYRGDEVPYGRKGDVRGNPKFNDGYLLMTLKVEYKIKGVKLDFIGLNRYRKTEGLNTPRRRVAKRRR
jgi:hypothetical protein